MIKLINISRNIVFQNDKPDRIRIPKRVMDEYIFVAKEIEKRTNDVNNGDHKLKFPGKNHYPLLEEMVDHKVAYRLRKYLPSLVFYMQANIDDGSSDYKESMDYIESLINENVFVLDNDIFDNIENITRAKWTEMSLSERSNIFKPLVDNYECDEFDNFLLDLGWKKFMSLRGYSKSKFVHGYMPEKTIKELREIWEECMKKRR